MPRIAQVQKRPQQSMKCESYYPLVIDPAALYTAFKQHLKQHLKKLICSDSLTTKSNRT